MAVPVSKVVTTGGGNAKLAGMIGLVFGSGRDVFFFTLGTTKKQIPAVKVQMNRISLWEIGFTMGIFYHDIINFTDIPVRHGFGTIRRRKHS